jgi:hypothetical protein
MERTTLVREHPLAVLASLLLDHTLRDLVQDDEAILAVLVREARNHEDAG